jgi:hypothetical protein
MECWVGLSRLACLSDLDSFESCESFDHRFIANSYKDVLRSFAMISESVRRVKDRSEIDSFQRFSMGIAHSRKGHEDGSCQKMGLSVASLGTGDLFICAFEVTWRSISSFALDLLDSSAMEGSRLKGSGSRPGLGCGALNWLPI